ncbi:prephenate dehydrogenase [Terriglobus tenax]|uniref:prephenate dehydrogenase n=1 Tax=Terriglobus tenax TaxID=1111115 RepID=UPI0021DFFEF7|nr:prephenate dehydrogenase [Terriglobus tenax]
MNHLLIVGTGLIGASTGLALKAAGFTGTVTGFDASGHELEVALERGAIDIAVRSRDAALDAARDADVILLAVPVLAILDWINLLGPILKPGQLVTDTGSTKAQIAEAAAKLFTTPEGPHFLPGHPMAGKESGGAAIAEATLFQNAVWIFTPTATTLTAEEREWRSWMTKIGAKVLDLDPSRHDDLLAWVSHLPQMVSTALSALLEDTFGDDEDLRAIGGRALREMTRLGSSPYSMWRDVAMTNTKPLADSLLALEQRLQHLRENLRTPELREEFKKANKFREPR